MPIHCRHILTLFILLTTYAMASETPFIQSISPTNDDPAEDCAMWWPTPDDKTIEASETMRLISTIYSESDGFESFILARFLSHLGFLDPKARRVRYPEETIYQSVRHRSGIHLIVSIDQEHGIRFRFPIQSCPVAKRNQILKEYLEFVQSVRTEYLQADRDPDWDPKALSWWSFTLKAIKKMEAEGQAIEKIGVIPYKKQP